MSRLAITGCGVVSPLGIGAGEVLAALDAKRSAIGPTPPLPGGEGSGWASRIESFDSSPYIPPMRARRLDRGSLFAVAAARLALAEAGLTGLPALTQALAVLVGTASAGSGPLTVFLDALYRQGPEAAPPFEFPNTVANAPASHVSIELGLKGPNLTLTQGESVLGQALLAGRLLLADDRAERLLVGAVDEWNPYFQVGYDQLRALASPARPGRGWVMTEGATLLVLESEDAAAERRVPVLARLLGVAVGAAAGEPFRWVPDAAALERVIRAALADAGLGPSDVGTVFLAANGVAEMEAAEAEALARVFAGRSVLATGIKGALGERAVVGATSLAVAAAARWRGLIPPFAGAASERWPALLTQAAEPTALPAGAILLPLYGLGGNLAALLIG